MKYKATISTRSSNGQFEAATEQEVLNILEGWFLDYRIDYKSNMVIPKHGNAPSVTCWQKGHTAITCNFDATTQP